MHVGKRLGKALTAALLVLTSAAISLTPAQADTQAKQPPAAADQSAFAAANHFVDGKLDREHLDAKPEKAKGPVKFLDADENGKPLNVGDAKGQAGYVAAVDFTTPLNYCQQGLAYPQVKNNTGSTQWYTIYFYHAGRSTPVYGSIAAYGTSSPPFLGVNGSWSASLYVWTGSSYAYDEYESSTLNCNVSMTFYAYPGYTGYVLLQFKNSGNAYASILDNELAPFPAAGTYTGSHWNYPAPNGGVVNRYLYVGTGLKYGIYAQLYGALYYLPWFRYGTL